VDIAAWLQRLGLEQYEQAFRENDVDAEVLPELTAEDLIGLGVTSIGHRRKLLAAIVALREKPPPGSENTGQITALARQEAPGDFASLSAERRQATVMFCDLVSSTELSARLDPEDLREVISAYHRAVSEIVSGFDGFVAKYIGDGVLVYFGYRRAHEDDAERAVRAGLGSIDAVGRLDIKSVKLQARVGIATGLVVVGDRNRPQAACSLERPRSKSIIAVLTSAARSCSVQTCPTLRQVGRPVALLHVTRPTVLPLGSSTAATARPES